MMSRHLLTMLLAAPALAGCIAATPAPAPEPLPKDPYARLTPEDVRLAAATMAEALATKPDGESLGWRNRTSGHAGTIKPLRTFVTSNGYLCRAYQEELRLGPKADRFQHEACRNEEGAWVWL